MDNWICKEINWGKEIDIKCFKRKMAATNVRRKEYDAYIYICNFRNEDELISNWESVNSKIAVYDQSNIEALIERSNFYICFFVREKISVRTQKLIEDDTFSAKKYVFVDENMNLEDKCHYLENRIFTININAPINVKEKVKNIELQNFRAYEGRNQINFCKEDGKPASFVTIYAPNGIGKTSIFDGLEYAFKGNIGRLSEIPDKEIGAIYHNRNKSNKKAFVNVELEISGEIRRNVSNIKKGGNDTRRNPPLKGKGRDLVGDPEQWEQTILPHDKIDSFITAKSGTDRYDEWIKSTNIESSISDDFLMSFKEMNSNVKKLTDIADEIKRKKEEIIEHKKQTDGIEMWKTLIMKYNQQNKERQLLDIKKAFDEATYDTIVNSATQYLRKDLDNIEISKKNQKLAEKFLGESIGFYIERLNKIPQCKKNISNIQKKIEDRKKYDDLIQKNKIHKEEMQKFEKELEPLNEIVQFGVENITKQKEEYLSRKQEIDIHNDDFSSKLKQQNQYRTLIDEKERKIEEINLKVSDEKKNNTIQKKTINFIDASKNLEEEVKAEEEIIQKEKDITKKIVDASEELKILNEKYIKDKLCDLKLQDVLNNSEFLEVEFVENLKELLEEYQKTINLIERNQEKSKRFLKNQKELEELKQSGQKYINQQQDITDCPLCHTPFYKWDKLFDAVNEIKEDGNAVIKDELKALQNDIVKLNASYDEKHRAFKQIHEELINKKRESIDNLEKEKKLLTDPKKILNDKKNKLIEEIDNIRIILEKEKIEVINESSIKNWFERQNDYINKLKEDYSQFKDELSKLGEEQVRIDKLKLEQKKMIENPSLAKLINFLIRKPSNFNVMVEKNMLDKNIDEKKKIIKNSTLEISKIEIKEEETVIFLLDKQAEEQKMLDDDIKFSNECESLKPLSKENIQKKLDDWNNEIDYLNSNIEILHKILEESGIREYNKTLKKLKLEEKKKELEFEKKSLKQDELKEKFETTKAKLEKNLDEYFNQTIISEVFQKIDPHQTMKNIEYEFSINKDEKPELFIRVSENEGSENKDSYRPESFFSSAQLNMVAFSSFFSRALQAKDLPISTIFIDDPIGHFDDINILGFSDLLRSVMEVQDCQIVLTTHDDKIFQILKRKLSNEYYSSKFIKLPEDCILLDQIN